MNDITETQEKCGSCGRKLKICSKGHYVCTKCEKNHSCFQKEKEGFSKRMQTPRA